MTFECPRCRRSADARYYGPCTECREALRASFAAAAREVEDASFEPAMHVTPNAVALKDD